MAVTLGLLLLAAGEVYAFRRHLLLDPEIIAPAVQKDLAEHGTPAEREYWKEYAQSNEVTYHPWVLWRTSPYPGKLLSIDQNGVRRTLHTQCDDKTFTIWMYGDSVMWGAGGPDAATIPSYVAQDYEKAGKPVCIVNLAEHGWSNTQEMISLIEQLKHAARKPDIVLFYDGGTEAFAAYQSGQADVHSNEKSFKTFLDNWRLSQKAGFFYLRQTNTYHFLESIAARRSKQRSKDQAPGAGLDIGTLSQEVVENYIQNMDLIETLAQHYGFRAIFAWYPSLPVGHKEMTPYEQKVLATNYKKFPNVGLMYQAVYKRGREINRPDFYYLGDFLDNQKSTLFVDISHLRPEGNQIVADKLYEILTAKNPEHATGSMTANASDQRPQLRRAAAQ